MRTIGIDLDDILLDFNGAFIKFHNQNYNTTHTIKDITSFYLEDVWKVSLNEILERLDLFYKSEHHSSATPVVGAVEAINELAKDNILQIVTASPEEYKPGITNWLDKHFPGKFKSVYYVKRSLSEESLKHKGEVCNELGVDVFIDDAVHNSKNIADCGTPVLLLDTPWNQGFEHPLVTRVYSWDEILGILKR